MSLRGITLPVMAFMNISTRMHMHMHTPVRDYPGEPVPEETFTHSHP